MASEIEALIERLEKATGPDRELDRAIAVAVGRAPWDGEREWRWECGAWFHPDHPTRICLHFTRSADAALTLVPGDARVRELGQWWDVNAPGGWFCSVMRWEYDAQARVVERAYTFGFSEDDSGKMPPTAPTAAIALCIASLRARATQEK